MKLNPSVEPRLKRPRSREAAGLEAESEQGLFVPERDLPREYREEWLRQIEKPYNNYRPTAEKLAAFYTLTFPGRVADVDLDKIWKKHKPLLTEDEYFYLLVLFPGRGREIKEKMEKQFGPNLEHTPMRGQNQGNWSRLSVVLRVLFPDQLPRHLPNMEEHWKFMSEVGPVPPGLTDLTLLFDVRLMFPERFKQLNVSPEHLQGLKEKVMEALKAWRRGPRADIDLHSTRYVADLCVVLASEIKIHPMGGIEVIQGKRSGLVRASPLPDRSQV